MNNIWNDLLLLLATCDFVLSCFCFTYVIFFLLFWFHFLFHTGLMHSFGNNLNNICYIFSTCFSTVVGRDRGGTEVWQTYIRFSPKKNIFIYLKCLFGFVNNPNDGKIYKSQTWNLIELVECRQTPTIHLTSVSASLSVLIYLLPWSQWGWSDVSWSLTWYGNEHVGEHWGGILSSRCLVKQNLIFCIECK